ncbi:MAG: TfoX/Sxy family protein [Pauljensenia sp.]
MASTPEYLAHVLDLLGRVKGVTHRAMMGEYLLYARGTLFGGVYDDRFLLKETPASSAALTAQCSPYPGAKPMRLVDVEDRDALADLVERVRAEL